MANHARTLAAALIAIATLWAQPSSALEKYICAAEKSNGFKWNGKDWVHTSFRVDAKYLVEEVTPQIYLAERYNFTVTHFGAKNPEFRCERPEIGNWKSELISCGTPLMGMVIDTKSPRYVETYALGYIGGEDFEGNTPFVALGTCVPLSQ